MYGFTDKRILQHVKAIKETADIKEIAQLLSTGNWIAIYAIEKDMPLFVLAKIH